MVRLPTFIAHVTYRHAGLLLLLEIGRFSFDLIQLSKSKNHDMVGVKNIIRTGSYMIESVLAAVRIRTIGDQLPVTQSLGILGQGQLLRTPLLKAHLEFQNPRSTPSRRKVNSPKEHSYLPEECGFLIFLLYVFETNIRSGRFLSIIVSLPTCVEVELGWAVIISA